MDKPKKPPRSTRADDIKRELQKSTDFKRQHIDELVIAAVGCCGFGAIRVVRHRSGGVRLVGRIAGGAAVLISIGALSMYGCAMSLTYRSPALVSPDGSH